MKVTAWTNEEYAREHYRDLFDERLALLNPNKKPLTPTQLKEMAESKGIPYEEFVKTWLDEYKKIPQFIDEDRANAYGDILSEIEKCVIEHCKKTGIRFSASYHQYGNYGVPIIDDTYMYYTFARTWGYIMAKVDGDDSDKGYLRYYLHTDYVRNPVKLPCEVEGEICI